VIFCFHQNVDFILFQKEEPLLVTIAFLSNGNPNVLLEILSWKKVNSLSCAMIPFQVMIWSMRDNL
jgi:hypothetical protein